MSDWASFAADDPSLASRGVALFTALEDRHFTDDGWFGIGFLATIREDGGPRLTPVCPIVAKGKLLAAIVPPKVGDLDRDPRFVLHAFLGPSDAEFAIIGTAARAVDDAVVQAAHRVVEGNGMLADPNAGEVLFELSIDAVNASIWDNVGKPGTRPVRTRWRARRSRSRRS